jgi:hypothetical protein
VAKVSVGSKAVALAKREKDHQGTPGPSVPVVADGRTVNVRRLSIRAIEITAENVTPAEVGRMVGAIVTTALEAGIEAAQIEVSKRKAARRGR